MPEELQWTDVEEIGYRLYEAHPQLDPLHVRFTDLRRMVEALPGFQPLPGHSVNEQILEAIQAAWLEEYQDDAPARDEEDHYTPPSPFKPDPVDPKPDGHT